MGFYNEYSYEYPPAMNSIASVLMIYMLILLVWGIFELVCYIIKGIGLYTIAKRQGAEYPWLAFIPFARTYLQGELGGDILLKKKSIRTPGIWLVILPIIEGVAVFIFYLLVVGIIGFGTYSTMNYYGSGAGMIVTLILVMLGFILIMIVFGAALQVLRVLVNHQILERFTSRNMSIVHAILMGIVPLYEPICFLIMSRRPYNPGMEPKSEMSAPEQEEPQSEGLENVVEHEVPPVQSESSESGFVVQRGLLNQEENIISEEPETSEESETSEEPEKPEENE